MMFFSYKSLNIENDFSFEINLLNIPVSDICSDDSFLAYFSAIGADYVLMQNVKNLKIITQPQLQPFLNRSMPNSSKQSIKATHNYPTLPQIKGYIASPDQTTMVRTQSVKLCKYINMQLLKLYEILLNLKTLSHGYSKNTKYQNLASQIYVLSEMVKNVLVQLTNNQNPSIPANDYVQQNNTFELLKDAQNTAYNIVVGFVKLNKMLVIPNINPWLDYGVNIMCIVCDVLNFANSKNN